MTTDKIQRIDRPRGDESQSAVRGLRQRASAHARAARDRLVDVPVLAWALGIWIVHGLLDTTVTIGAVVVFETTEVESNPWIRAYLLDGFREFTAGVPPLIAFGEAAAIMLGGVAIGALGIVVLDRFVAREVVVSYSLLAIAAGIIVVANNLFALRSLL